MLINLFILHTYAGNLGALYFSLSDSHCQVLIQIATWCEKFMANQCSEHFDGKGSIILISELCQTVPSSSLSANYDSITL